MITLGFTERSVPGDQTTLCYFIAEYVERDSGLEAGESRNWRLNLLLPSCVTYSWTPNLSVPQNANLPDPEFGQRGF